MIIDIDDFKEFNYTYGHLVGDEVIESVTEILSNQKRTEDDFVARFGGDEFIAILPNSTKKDAIIFAEAFREGLLVVSKKLNIDIEVTVSIGIASSIPSENESEQ